MPFFFFQAGAILPSYPKAWALSGSRKYVEQCLTVKTPSLEDVFWEWCGHILKRTNAAKMHLYLLSLKKPSGSNIYHYNSSVAATLTQKLLRTNLYALGRFSPLRKLLQSVSSSLCHILSPPAIWIFPPFQHRGTLWMYLQATMFCIQHSMDLKKK